MTDYHDVRDALCNMRDQPDGTLGINGKRLLSDAMAYCLASHFVRALRAAESGGMEEGIAALTATERAGWVSSSL